MDASPASPQPFPASQHSPGWLVLVPARGQGGFNGTYGAMLLAPSCPHRSDPSGSGWRMPHLAPPQRAGICPRSAPLPAQHPALRAGDTPTPQHPGGVNPTGSSSSGPGHTARGQGAARGRDVQGSERAQGVAQARREEGSVAGTRAQAGTCAPRGALLCSAPKVPRSPLSPWMGTATARRQPGRGGRGQDGQGVGGSARCRRGQRLRPALTQQGWGLAPAWDWGRRPGCRALQGPVPRASSGPTALPHRTMGQHGGLSHSPTRGHRPSVGCAP